VNTFFPGRFAFKTEGQDQAAATLGLLGLPAGIGYEQVLASLSGGALTGQASPASAWGDG
jgi:hypothetical protein